MTKLEQAARQALEALLDYHKADDDRVSVAMSILQEALAEHVERVTEGNGSEVSLETEAQEPVAWLWKPSKPFPQYTVITDKKEYLKAAKEQGVEITPLYAAPVRTKDLTDDEMEELCRKYARFELIREAIAADREKNK